MMQDDRAGREPIFWALGPYGEALRQAMAQHLTDRGLAARSLSPPVQGDQSLPRDGRYLLFYRFSDASSAWEARLLAMRDGLDVRFVALCTSHAEGLLALERGDCYALKVPPDPRTLLICCRRFC